MVFSASTYYFIAMIRFDITAKVWFLPQLAMTSSPSVSQIMSLGQNYTCEGQTDCRAVIRGLQPLTQYDVYYWYMSEAGTEPLTAVSEMMRRLYTIDIIPYNLVIEAAAADYKTITVVVSNEQRGGYVWCKAGEVDTVPSIIELKTTEPLILEEGEEEGRKIIPNLLPDTTYYGYCYVEDFYGDPAANSIESTRFVVHTLLEEAHWTLQLNATMTEVIVDLEINRDGQLCCQLDSLDEVCGNVTSNVLASLSLPAEDDREYTVQCVMHTTSLLDLVLTNASQVIRTPSRPPEFFFDSPIPRYNAILLSLFSDRSAYMWCMVVEPTYTNMPSVADMKTGQRFTVAREVTSELLITGLQPVTTYRLWCYGETFEGLSMVNPRENLTWVVETLTLPPSLTVLSYSASPTSVRLSVSPSIPATVRCLAQSPEAPTPSVAAFYGSEGVYIELLGEVEVTGLTEDTDYAAYCMAWDAYNQTMLTPVADTKQLFRTPLDRHMLFVTYVTMYELTATISLVSSANATAWCMPVHANDVVPTAETLKASGQSTFLIENVPMQMTFEGLEPDYTYASYCYSESERGLAQEGSIASTRVNFHSLDYPVIVVTMSSVSTKTLDLDLTSSTSGTIICRARVEEPNNLPPTEEWIQAGQSISIAQPSIVNYMTVQSLQPSTAYQLYCLGKNSEGTVGLQSLSDRMLTVTTAADVVGPSVLFSTDPDDYTLPSQPVNVTVQFSETVQSFDVEDLLLENCHLLSYQQITSQLSYLLVAPRTYGIFSITLPANKVFDLSGNGNSQQILARTYPEGLLSASLQAVEPLYAVLSVQYSYPANVSCVALPSAAAPSTCSALQATPGAAWVDVAGGVSSELTLRNIAVNSTFYAYCCAEEPNSVVSGSIGSTEVRIVVDWLECPRNESLVCSGQGSCLDGQSCSCDLGFYGGYCESFCPGLLRTNASVAYECRGHGVCQTDSFVCQCEEGFQGPDCAPQLLEGSVAAEGARFVYVVLQIDATDVSESEYQTQEQQLALLSALASQLGLDRSQTRVETWDRSASAARRLAQDASLNATCVLNVPESQAQSVQQSLNDPAAMTQLSSNLNANGLPNNGVTLSQLLVLSSGQTDPYTCYDGLQNADETDVDCGGVCLAKCGVGKRCLSDKDCASQLCEEGACKKKTLGAGWIVVIVLLVVVVVCIVVLLVLMCIARHNEKKAKEEMQQQLNRERQKKQLLIVSLEELNKQEERKLKKLQEEVEQLKEKEAQRNLQRQNRMGEINPESLEHAEEVALRKAENGEDYQRVIEMPRWNGQYESAMREMDQIEQERNNANPNQKRSAPHTPNDATSPMNSTDPQQSDHPIASAEPIEPTEPVEPLEPVQPAEPLEPTEPVQPIEPTEPVQPTEPVEPVNPDRSMEGVAK